MRPPMTSNEPPTPMPAPQPVCAQMLGQPILLPRRAQAREKQPRAARRDRADDCRVSSSAKYPLRVPGNDADRETRAFKLAAASAATPCAPPKK